MIQPNLFLVGAMKAATTSIASYLGTSPDIFTPPIKEPNHFCAELHERNIARRHPTTAMFDLKRYLRSDPLPERFFAFVENYDDYLSLYRGYAGQRFAIDSSTTYLNSPVAAERIAEKAPDARIIIMTRDSAQRAWAEYVMNLRIGTAGGDYRAALERERAILSDGDLPLFERYASTGLYPEHIARFRRVFGEERVFVADLSELGQGSDRFAARLWSFLGLPAQGSAIPRDNEQLVPRFRRTNTLLHRYSIKSTVSQWLPESARRLVRRTIYSRAPQPMPDDFAAMFPAYLDSARRIWAETGRQ